MFDSIYSLLVISIASWPLLASPVYNEMEWQPSMVNESGGEQPSAIIKSDKYGIDIFDEPHRDAVALALYRILSIEAAKTTCAQIVDGLPLP